MAQQSPPSLVSRTPVLETVEAQKALIRTNSLQAEGKQTFHLKMDVQTYDLQGLHPEQGTIEYWWAGPQGFRVEVTTPSLGTVHSLDLQESMPEAGQRSLFLMAVLLDSVRFAGGVKWPAYEPLTTETRNVGQTELKCTLPTKNRFEPVRDDVCVDPGTTTIRIKNEGPLQIVRNRSASFAGTRVAVNTTVTSNGLQLIEGTIGTLESLAPGFVMDRRNSESGADGSLKVSGAVINGHRLPGARPQFPDEARRQHLHGSVIFAAKITKQGTIADLIPIVSPNAILTSAATDAVKSWTYKPYLLNDEPVEVNTTVTVNFNGPVPGVY